MKPLRVSSPFAVIVTFLSIAEAALGTAAALTDGGVRWLFAVFAVLFPVYVAVQFFWILCRKNAVLYPPGAFGTPGVADYVNAMARVALPPAYEVLKEPVEQGVRDVLAEIRDGSDDTEVSEVDIDHYSELIMESLRALQYVAVRIDPAFDASPRGRRGTSTYDVRDRTWLIPYSPERQVDDFIHDVYRNLGRHPSLDPKRYGRTWCLTELDTDTPLTREPKRVRLFALAYSFEADRDQRTLKSAGVTAGMVLVVQDMPGSGCE